MIILLSVIYLKEFILLLSGVSSYMNILLLQKWKYKSFDILPLEQMTGSWAWGSTYLLQMNKDGRDKALSL